MVVDSRARHAAEQGSRNSFKVRNELVSFNGDKPEIIHIANQKCSKEVVWPRNANHNEHAGKHETKYASQHTRLLEVKKVKSKTQQTSVR